MRISLCVRFVAYCALAGTAPAVIAQTSTTASTGKSPGAAVGLMVYPAKGQAADVQSKDEAECYEWAKTQTGYDPASPPAPAAQTAEQPKDSSGKGGQRVRGAARGAAAGAIIGEVADDDASKGAAVGATAGAISGGRQKRKDEKAAQEQAQQQAEAQQQQAQAAQQEQLNKFKDGMAVCLQGRGYTAK